MVELKPCPFCGRKAEVWKYQRYKWDMPTWTIGCKKQYTSCVCEIGCGKQYLSEEEAIEAWNKRYEPPIESRKCDDCGEVMKFVSLDGRGKSVGYFECKECGCQTNIFWYPEPKSPNGAYTPAREERLKRGNKNA